MREPLTARLSGRQAQAARNDLLILEAAREVFTADPEAPTQPSLSGPASVLARSTVVTEVRKTY